MKPFLFFLLLSGLVSVSLTACTSGGRGVQNIPDDRGYSRPRRGSY